MAKTKEQWFQTLKTWYPSWWFSDEDVQDAVLYGIAAVFERLGVELDNHFIETFICQSHAGYLDEHGFERNLTRSPGELDSIYCERVRNIVNSVNCPAIKAIVDALLDVGESSITEDWEGGVYFNRDYYFNRGYVLIDVIYNAFSIIVDRQVHAPYSFYNRENFFGREDFIGTNESSLELFQLIVDAVNNAKAFGTVYRLIERLE